MPVSSRWATRWAVAAVLAPASGWALSRQRNLNSRVKRQVTLASRRSAAPALLVEEPSRSKEVVPTRGGAAQMDARAVAKFFAPTLALWVAPPLMSLIDTAVVGRY